MKRGKKEETGNLKGRKNGRGYDSPGRGELELGV
jgi:hypothetical protein